MSNVAFRVKTLADDAAQRIAWLQFNILAAQAMRFVNLRPECSPTTETLTDVGIYLSNPDYLQSEIEKASKNASWCETRSETWKRVYGEDFYQFIMLIVNELDEVGSLSEAGLKYLKESNPELIDFRPR